MSEDLYAKLSVKRGPVIDTQWGPLQSVTARADAWICASCGESPFADSHTTRFEIEGTHRPDCIWPEDCSCDFEAEAGPITLFSEGDYMFDFHLECARRIGVLDSVAKASGGSR